MKAILVIIGMNHGAAQAWLQRQKPGIRDQYDWRSVSEVDHLYGYRDVEYVDLGSSNISPYILDDFKARNRPFSVR